MSNKKYVVKNRIPVFVSSMLIACTVQYAQGAWAEGAVQEVEVEGKADCSDGHRSQRCGWGVPDPFGGGEAGGGFSNGYSEGSSAGANNPPKRTAKQKEADAAKCKEQQTQNNIFASNVYTSNMNVCAATNSSWYGFLHDQWLKFGPVILGYPPMDCASVNNKAYFDVQQIIDNRYKSCYEAAMKD